MTGFGPQLIGETEKALNGVLLRVLDGTGLDEPHWVTLRLAAQVEADESLVEVVRARAHRKDADQLVADLTRSGHLVDGRPSASGKGLLTAAQDQVRVLTGPIWAGLDPADVAATERILNLVADRTRAVLARE